MVTADCAHHQAPSESINAKIPSDSDFLKPGLSVNCWNNSVWSVINEL